MNTHSQGSYSRLRLAQRIGSIGVSEILRIGETARRLRLAGRPVIALGAGEPDFDTPQNVKDAAAKAIRDGLTKYTTLDGTAELKSAIVEKFRRENSVTYGLDEVTVGAGAKQVIYNAFMATLDRGDEVILAAPYWTSYADIVTICEGRPIPVIGHQKNGFRLDPADLERAITARTRWLLLNSPSNPSGAAYSEGELRQILAVLKRHPHVWLMMDDIYEHLVYDDLPFVTAVQLEPELKSRTLTVNGVSKAYAMTGWRIGFAGGPSDLIAAMAVVQSQSTSNPCSISQAASVEALLGPQDVRESRRLSFQQRRDIIVDQLNAVEGIDCRRPDGAFYAFAGCGDLLGRHTPEGDLIDSDIAFCRYLLERGNVAVIPGSCFGFGPFFRVSYAASDAELVEACGRIRQLVEALR